MHQTELRWPLPRVPRADEFRIGRRKSSRAQVLPVHWQDLHVPFPYRWWLMVKSRAAALPTAEPLTGSSSGGI